MNRRIIVDTGPLARVEGEGSLLIEMDGKRVVNVQLKIFEPPRYYEAFLRGRKVEEVVDMVPRICGICPVAYQISALNAIEGLFGVEVPSGAKTLRALLYLGEWIESHALHVFMLAAPDYFGVPDCFALYRREPELVKQALRLKQLGNRLMAVIGGREVHPVSLRIGGVHKLPHETSLKEVRANLKSSLEFAMKAVALISRLEAPHLARKVTYVALRSEDGYAFLDGDVMTSDGARITPSRFEEEFVERQVGYSNSLRSLTKDGRPYMVGPLARVNMNFDRLSPSAAEVAEKVGLAPMEDDPFKSMLARAVELVHACEETVRLIGEYDGNIRPHVPYEYKEGTGYGVSEAPRGVLYHRYEVDRKGQVLQAKIVPPTAQNQMRIEEDVRLLMPKVIRAGTDRVRRLSEMAVRNYDPCISCATHFLKVNIVRRLRGDDRARLQ